MSIRIVEVRDEYVNYLKQFFSSTILDNKMDVRKHPRKYIGILIHINNYNYFAPLSSPKPSDYNLDGSIKKSTIIVFRMVDQANGDNKLLGSIKLNNMIPVPYEEIIEYDVNNETDITYKVLIQDELMCIQRNTTRIQKTAKRIYYLKINENTNINDLNRKFYKSIMPFKEVEEKCIKYINYKKGEKL